MEHIKQIIKNEINMLKEDEVDIFKKSIEEMFTNLVESVNTKHQSIEESIENSYKNLKNQLYFSSTLIQVNELKYYGDEFYPIVKEKNRYSYENILESIHNNEKIKLAKLFFESSYLNEIDENRVFSGSISTEEKTYDVEVKLTKFETYKNELKDLYNYSKNNFLTWTTPNMPFLNSFFEVELIDFPQELIDAEEILDIQFDLESLEGKYIKNLCPVWSIKKEIKINSSEPTLIFKDVYRYKTGLDNSVIPIFINENYRIFGLDFDFSNNLEISINIPNIKEFNYYLIEKKNSIKSNNNVYPIWSNEKSENFLSSYSSFYNQRIRSLGEIRRVLHSINDARDFILKEVYVTEREKYEREIVTYEINEWLSKDLRDEARKDLMILIFQKDIIDSFTTAILSFIISEIQLLFPEYLCVGEIEWII